MRSRVYARGRVGPVPGGMNKTEQRYGQHLAIRHLAGEVIWYAFEPFKLRLAKRTWYTPDFAVMLQDRSLEIHEVKAHWEDDARVKIKVAAETYSMFKFVAVKWVKKAWQFEEF